jgi:general stress protein 26
MSSDSNDCADAERRLWREIERHQIGMLGLTGSDAAHFQPMTAFAEPADDLIWFYTRNDTDLAKQVAAGRRGAFVFQSRELYACIEGELVADHDDGRIQKYWNSVVAAWYPEGRDDARLTLLRLDCASAQVWLSEGGPLRFAWEIVKANAARHEPHVGRRADINFH